VCAKSRAAKVSIEYWFPWGMLSSTILRLQAGYQATTGTIFQLQTFRSVPDDAECVNFALNGNIEGLKHLFSNGLASPRDVSPTRGYTLLRWALYGKQYATCDFLIHAGADPDYKPISANDNSPRIKACHFLLEGGLPNVGIESLRLITRGGHYDDFIDEAGFTQVHRIVLGLSMKSLQEELALHPEDIDAQDFMGRTPLSWAAAKGDTRTVVALLSHGADPNIIDAHMSGPMSNAAAQGHTACVRLLLEAGAYPDALLPPGVRKGSPLNVAARRSNDISLVKSLLDFGADIESSGIDGITSLIHVSRTDNASFAMLFLEYGADINATSVAGTTPLTTAITHNSHNVLRLILERWHEYTDCPRLKGPHLLHITALYADIETLQILAGTDHLRVRQDRNYGIGDFSDRLRQRADHTEKLSCAFEELLHVINSAPDARQSPDQLVEVGFLQPINTCARPAPIANQMECLTGNHPTDRFTHLGMLNADDDPASSDDAFEEASETFQVRE
jgi:ankyrin repeat protein